MPQFKFVDAGLLVAMTIPGMAVGLLGALLFLTGCGLKDSLVGDPAVAIENARTAYADLRLEKHGLRWLGAHAANSDSDENGYISTLISILDERTGEVVILDWECGGGKSFSFVSGCKARIATLRSTAVNLNTGK